MYSKLKLSPYTDLPAKKLQEKSPVKVCTAPVWYVVFYRHRCKKVRPATQQGRT